MKSKTTNYANTIFKSSPCPIILLSLDHEILDINPTALKIYKWQEKNVVNKNYLDLCKKAKFPCPISKTKHLSDKNITTTITHSDKTYNIEWSFEASSDKNDNDCYVLIGKEIVDLEKGQNELIEKISVEILSDKARNNMSTEQKVRWVKGFINTVITNMPGYVFWKDENFIYMGSNDNVAKRICGFKSRKDMPGINDYQLAKRLKWTQELADYIRSIDEQIIHGSEQITSEETLTTSDGDTTILLTNKNPIKDENNNIIGVMGMSSDITEHRSLEKELRRAKQLQEKAQNAKIQGMMEIAAGIAHEIRTPLTSIQCAADAQPYMDRLIDAYNKAEAAGLSIESIRPSFLQSLKTIFKSIDAEAKESMNIIDMFLNNLKSMVKEANTGDYQLCTIQEAVSSALDRYPFGEIQKNSVVYTDADDFKFYGVNLLIQHIIFNLMKNALYYLAEKPSANITIWHEQGDTDNYLHFKDTGPGISEYDQSRIFDFGFSKRKEGSGFGLTYCKTTMQQMGGDIAVRSELGKHTEFILTFPKVAE